MSVPAFKTVFANYLSVADTPESLAEAAVLNVQLSRAKTHMTVRVHPAAVPSAAELKAVAAALSQSLKVAVTVLPGYSAAELNDGVFALLVDLLRERHPAVNGHFIEAEYTLAEQTLTVQLKEGGLNALLGGGSGVCRFAERGVRRAVFGCAGRRGRTEHRQRVFPLVAGKSGKRDGRRASRTAGGRASGSSRRRAERPRQPDFATAAGPVGAAA